MGTWQISSRRYFTHQGIQAEFSQRGADWGWCIVKLGYSNSCESCGYKFQVIATAEPLLPPTFYNFIAKEVGLAFILLCFLIHRDQCRIIYQCRGQKSSGNKGIPRLTSSLLSTHWPVVMSYPMTDSMWSCVHTHTYKRNNLWRH